MGTRQGKFNQAGMEPGTQAKRAPDPQSPSMQGEADVRHRPFRTWALQQDLFSLLGGEPAWEASDKVGQGAGPTKNPDAAPEILGGG